LPHRREDEQPAPRAGPLDEGIVKPLAVRVMMLDETRAAQDLSPSGLSPDKLVLEAVCSPSP
jgi:hypothetical protein